MEAGTEFIHANLGPCQVIELPRGSAPSPPGKVWAKCADGIARLLSENLIASDSPAPKPSRRPV